MTIHLNLNHKTTNEDMGRARTLLQMLGFGIERDEEGFPGAKEFLTRDEVSSITIYPGYQILLELPIERFESISYQHAQYTLDGMIDILDLLRGVFQV